MDTTASKRAEEALRASEERWKMAFRGSQDGIWEYNYETGQSYYSDRWKEMLGYAPDEIGNTREEWVDRIHPEDRLRVIKAFNDHLQGHTPNYGVEFRMRCKDDTYKWILARGLVVTGADGRPLRSAGSHTDITERKAAEAALAAERERLSVTLRAMAEGVIATDQHGVIQFINQAAESLTGWTDGAAIGRDFGDVFQIRHPHTKAPLPPLVTTAMRESRVVDLPPASILMHRQGVPVLVEGRCAPIRDASSLPVGVVLVLHDVTERARLEAEMLKATKLESVGVLAGGIAHDFNNLLTVVMGNLTLAMLDTQVMSVAGPWLQEAEKGLVRARDLTQQLLTFSRGGEPVRSAVQLGVVVREAAEFCLHGAKVKCRYAIESELWAAEVDKGQIGQVVQNLIINAVQAMPDGGRVQLELANDAAPPVRSGLGGAAIRLTIADTGRGIPPDHLAKVFDPYFTTKKEGTGLGLATVYSIIKKHGGHIEVDSVEGKGTTFRIWLPATRATVQPAQAQPVAADALTGRVLFMDDEENIRSMASTLLQRMGFEVEAAADGAAALRAYTEALGTPRAFNLVITDLTVPGGMGGRELMEKLLHLDPGVKAIVSSGYSSDPVMADYKAYGFKGMVPKPYRITDLAKTIRQVLEG
ncbi:MAG: PAS domain-containing protein [Verrucomicrobiota bacterium]